MRRDAVIVLALAAALLSLLAPVPDAFAGEHRLEAGGSFEAFPEGARGGHGSVVVGWQWRDAAGRWSTRALVDTDTLELRVDQRLGHRGFWWAEVKAQGAAASLLTDAYDDLALYPDAGFAARTLGGRIGAGRDLDGPWTWRFAVGARQWWFDTTADTEGPWWLLPDGLTVEAHTGMTYWRLQPDAFFDTRVVRHPRLRGTAWTLGLDTSTPQHQSRSCWQATYSSARNGFYCGTAGTAFDLRTRWLAGGDVGPVRLQLVADAGVIFNADNRHLPQVGGLHHAYVIPVAGLPWGAIRPTRHALAETSVHVPVGGQHEVGVAVDAGFANGAAVGGYVGSVRQQRPARALLGTAAFGDLRWASGWSLGVRAGYAPPMDWHAASPNVSGMISVGWVGAIAAD